jgi:uncharacterized membrane protein YdjX (TVP38/TMEM64 family)
VIRGSPAPEGLSPASPLLRASAAAIIAAAILALQLSPLRELVSPHGFQIARSRIDELGALAPVAFVGLCVAGIGLGLPRLGFAALGGVAFGWLAGSALAQLGTIGGCFVNFSWARYLGRELCVRRSGPVLRALVDRVARRPIATNVLLRLIPVGNSLALNSFLGICPISSRNFLLGTALGTFPETLVFGLFGAGAASGSGMALALGSLLFAALLAVTFAVVRRTSLDPESG